MFNEVVTGTNILWYLMAGVGVIGILAKLMNLITLRRMVKAAANMPKSTHKLMKLVRAKYEHACMTHERVENVEAFVEKYIYEYRGIVFRIHTWRQLEIQCIWFAGILAVFGATAHFMANGFGEEVYRYIGIGAAEMVLLFVISQISDEEYKRNAAKNYMVDYLQNSCGRKVRRNRQAEREQIDVIQTDPSLAYAGTSAGGMDGAPGGIQRDFSGDPSGRMQRDFSGDPSGRMQGKFSGDPSGRGQGDLTGDLPGRTSGNLTSDASGRMQRESPGGMMRGNPAYPDQERRRRRRVQERDMDMDRSGGYSAESQITPDDYDDSYRRQDLPINIEGEPQHLEEDEMREPGKTEEAKQSIRRTVKERGQEAEGQPALREEAIRQILEEFLA